MSLTKNEFFAYEYGSSWDIKHKIRDYKEAGQSKESETMNIFIEN